MGCGMLVWFADLYSTPGFLDVGARSVCSKRKLALLLNLVSSYLVLLQTGGLRMLYFRSTYMSMSL